MTKSDCADCRVCEYLEEIRVIQASVGGWVVALRGWNEGQDDALKTLAEQVEKLTIQMAQLMMAMQNELS